MRKARYFDENTQAWTLIHASQYKPEIHGKDLKCADPNCDAGMHFRVGHPADGESYEVPATFVSNSRADHVKDCAALQYERVEEHGVPLPEALEKGFAVVASTNFKAAHPHENTFGSNRLRVQKLDTPYNRWRQSNPHATQSVPNATAFEKFRDRLAEKKPGALSRLWVAHAQEVRRYSDIHLADQEAFKALAREMKDKAMGLKKHGADNVVVHGFPHYFTFKPTKNEREGRPAGSITEINGNGCHLYDEAGRSFILINQLVLSDPSWRDQIMEAGSVRVISTPQFNLTEFQHAARRFNAGMRNVEYFSLRWPVVSLDQLVIEEAPDILNGTVAGREDNERDQSSRGDFGRSAPSHGPQRAARFGESAGKRSGQPRQPAQGLLFSGEAPSPLGHVH